MFANGGKIQFLEDANIKVTFSVFNFSAFQASYDRALSSSLELQLHFLPMVILPSTVSVKCSFKIYFFLALLLPSLMKESLNY